MFSCICTFSSAHILLKVINSRKTYSGVIRLVIYWTELITQQALHGLLSSTIMPDGKLMRNFSITVKHIRAHWWWHARKSKWTGTLHYISFIPSSHEHKHTHIHLPLLQKADLFLPHLRSVLLSSAWIRALVWAITSSTGGEGPSIPPSICYSIPSSILGRVQAGESNAGGEGKSHHLLQLLRDHEENPPMTLKHLCKKQHLSFLYSHVETKK